MKKLLALVVAALFAMNVSAEKGSMYGGLTGVGILEAMTEGSAFLPTVGTGLTVLSVGDYSATAWGLAPEFGYFVSDNLAIGGVIGIGGIIIKDNPGDNPFAFRFNPYARYFLVQDGNFGFYLQGGVDFMTETASKINVLGIGINPGVSYNIGLFTATAAFGFLGFETLGGDGISESVSVFGLDLNMATLNFGLSYNF